MALTKTSLLDDALDQLNDNLVWEGNATIARNRLEAIRWLNANRAQVTAEAGASLSFESLAEEEKRLSTFVESVGTGASSRAPFVRGRAL